MHVEGADSAGAGGTALLGKAGNLDAGDGAEQVVEVALVERGPSMVSLPITVLMEASSGERALSVVLTVTDSLETPMASEKSRRPFSAPFSCTSSLMLEKPAVSTVTVYTPMGSAWKF